MNFTHGSKNWLQRAILYRHKELLLSREDWSFKPGETICTFWSVFLDFLWIDQFVWARALYATRYDHSPSAVTRPVMIKTIYGNAGLQMRRAQDPSIRSQPNFQGTQIRYMGKFLYRWRVCYYHQCGAQAEDRFLK